MAAQIITCYGGADREWHSAILQQASSLREGFRPSFWVRSSHVQNALAVVRGDTAPSLPWDLEERLTMTDGGTVSVQWTGLSQPAHAPVLVVLHTITGSGDGLRRFIASMRARCGWVVAACNRRGHGGLELTAPQINTMGSTADLRCQLDAIEARRPGAPLYGVGVSAGSGLLVRYLGEQGLRSRLRAGVALCPAYDITDAFLYADRRYDRYLTRKMVQFFLLANRHALSHIEGFEACASATTLAEFHDRLYPLAGFHSREEFYARSNPMDVARNLAVPLLVINSADDPVCVERNVHRHLDDMRRLPRITLAVTRHGGHCGFFETAASADTWADRVIAEYLQAAHALLR